MRTNTYVRRIATALAGVLALGMAAGVPAAEAATPVAGATIGGPLHAQMYPSGLETAPDGTIVIADTGNNRVARFNPDGTQVWSVGTFGTGTNQFDNPRDVAVDANNNVYVADTRNSRIVKLSPTGQWLAETTGIGGPSTVAFSFQLGVSVKGDKIYVGDTGRARVVVMDLNFNVLQTVTANGQCTNIGDNRDATADSAGNIYVAGYKTNEILKFSSTGTCLKKWGSTGTEVGQFRTPYGVTTHLDPVTGQELLYVADGLNNRVQVFTLDGAPVAQFGTFGDPGQVGTFTTMRRVAVDANGNVWAADLWGDRIERWNRTSTGFTYDRTIGAVMPDPTDTAVFHEPRGMAFAPNGDLWVSDTVHHQFVRFNSAGHIVDTCGQRAAEGTQLGQFNWPRGIAVDPATGNLWIADTKQHQLQVLGQDCQPLGQNIGFVKNTPAGTDTRSFNWPYDIAIRQSDRWAFVVDTQNHRIKAYDVANATWPTDNKGPLPAFVYGQRGTANVNFKFPSGIAVGPNGDVYVADRGNNRIQELSFSAGTGFTYVRTWNAGGTLNEPEGVAVDSTGRVIVADSGDNQMVVMAPDRSVEATVNGLNHPAAVEVGPDNRIYLADTYNDVVRTYTMGTTPPPDTVAPTGGFSAPAANAQVPVGPLSITGTASDNQSVAAVYVALRRNDTQQWLRANGTYGTGLVWVPATVASPGTTSSSWSFSTTLPVTGGYFMQVRVDDAAGNQNAAPKPGRSFSAVAAGDAATPTGTVTAPANNASVPAPVTITGTAADDTGVASVKLSIRQNGTNLWWNGTGWQAQTIKVNATLGTPNGTSTTWSYTISPSAGSYGFSTDITDIAGKLAAGTGKPAWRSFSVTG